MQKKTKATTITTLISNNKKMLYWNSAFFIESTQERVQRVASSWLNGFLSEFALLISNIILCFLFIFFVQHIIIISSSIVS